MKKALALVLLLGVSACTDEPTAERVLRDNGYSNIELTGWRAFSCGRDDDYATGFRATAPGGRRVTGAVCSAWLKGATIRFD